MSMVGADPDQLIALAKKMDHEANALDLRIRIPMRSLVGHSPWSGADAARFTNKLTKLLKDIRSLLL